MAAISLTRLCKRYGDFVAIDDVTARVEQGEFVTILGPSGSGKTTMLSMIAGLTEPSSGTIRFGERNVTHLPPAKRNVGLMFQSYALFPHLSVFENIAFPLKVRSLGRAEIAKQVGGMIAMLRLDGLERRRPAQLSGGQQQRVALARALVFSPDILLLDEPLGALDRKLREEVQVELRRLQRSLGTTTILVTHDQEEALSLSDRILVLDQGLLQQFAPPQQIYQRPNSAFVAGFLGTANFIEGRTAHAAGNATVLLADGTHLPLPANAPVDGRAIHAVIRPERAELVSFSQGASGLPGRVIDAIYLGQTVRYHVQTVLPQPFIVVAKENAIRFQRDEPVMVTWQSDDVWLLPDEPVDHASRSLDRTTRSDVLTKQGEKHANASNLSTDHIDGGWRLRPSVDTRNCGDAASEVDPDHSGRGRVGPVRQSGVH